MESIVLSTKLGWKMGFEPTTPGTTIQCSNQLSYNHHLIALKRCKDKKTFGHYQIACCRALRAVLRPDPRLG